MLNGMVMNGMSMIGVRIGLVLLMIGLVTGLGLKMTGVTGPMTGLRVLRTGGVLSSRVRVHLQVRKALRKSEPSQNVAAVTVETQDQNAARPPRTVRGAKPGMMTNLFVRACLLIGALSAGVPRYPAGMCLRKIN